MADTKLTDLTAASNLTGAQLYGAQSSASKKFAATLFAGIDVANTFTAANTFNAAVSMASTLGVTGAATFASGTLTGSSTPAISITQTWNNAATAFTAFDVNVTNTASLTTARLAAFRLAGTDVFWITRAGQVTSTGGIQAGAASFFSWSGRSVISSPSNGVMQFMDSTGLTFTRVNFGGGTTSFPALKRSTTALHVVLGDDSAFAPLSAAAITANAGTAIPAGGTAGAGLMVSSTANFGVFFGSGAPTLSAAKGSLYLRSDGSGTGDRAYINTDGSTTWTALTTAA